MLAGEPFALARGREGGDSLRAAVRCSGEDAVDVSLGRVRDPELRTGQPKAVALALGAQAEARRIRAGLGLAERERGDGLAAGEARVPLLAHLRAAAAEDRIAAEPLERERRLGLGAAVGEALAQLAELDRRAGEDELEQAVLAERAYE